MLSVVMISINSHIVGGIGMFAKRLFVGLVLTLVVGVNCLTAATVSGKRTVLVIPASYKVVQVGFDIVTLRAVKLVSYQKIAGSNDLLLHAWNPSADAWQELTPQMLRQGVLNVVAATVIGPDADDFINYTGANMWGGAIKLIPTYDVAEILNGLTACYNFKSYEWEWLARRYELDVEDTNYEERRYGKYGPPGSDQSRPVTDDADSSGDSEVVSTLLDDGEVVEVEIIRMPEEKGMPAAPVVVEKIVPVPVVVVVPVEVEAPKPVKVEAPAQDNDRGNMIQLDELL